MTNGSRSSSSAVLSSLSAYPFLLGFSSAAAQVLVMRTLVAALYGNELIFVLVLVGWFVGIATGSSALRLIFPKVQTGRMVGILLVLSGVLIPLSVLTARYVRSILGVTPGVLMDIGQASSVALVVVFPLSFVLGALFPVLVRLGREEGAGGGVARIYAFEAAGFVVGGIAVTFLGLPFLSTLGIAFILFGVNIVAAAWPTSWFRASLIAVLISGVLMTAGGLLHGLDAASQSAQWPGFRLIESRDTVYGNLQLVEKSGTKSLYENGLHIATTGDVLSSEENVHYALLAHPAPRALLMIGGGLAGGLNEALKHPGLKIDYLERDAAAIDMARRNAPDVDLSMSDPRVRVIADDGRRFIKKTDRLYDVVAINLSDPLTLLVNRYYTEEFFREVRRCLTPDGILAFSVTSSENYLNREGKTYLRMLRRTLGLVFVEVRSIPGDRHIFLAAQAEGRVSVSPAVLSRRLAERGISTRFVREEYFNDRLSPMKVHEVERDLLGKAPENFDYRPSAFLAALVFWSTHFRSSFANVAEAFRLNSVAMLFLPALVGSLAVLFRRNKLLSAGIVVGVAGFCLMLFQVAVMMAFQSYFGYVYAGIGLITAVFMAGAVLGSVWADRQESGQVRSRLQSLIVFAAVFAVALGILLPRFSLWGPEGFVMAGLFVFSLAAGAFGGAQFVLALRHAGEEKRNAGVIYAADVAGSAVGAILGGIFLIPLWGVDVAAFFCGLLQIAVLAALAR